MATQPAVFGSDSSEPVLDAIVVPTNRLPEYLGYAIELASTTNAFLLVFCSGRASASAATDRIISSGIRGLAVDIPAHYSHPLLTDFETDGCSDAMLGRVTNDVGLKRNLGLLVGRMAGWRNLLFLDDDITNIKGIDEATRLVANAPAAGFTVNEFPDNSVVRHAERLSGVEPGVKLSGGALMINLASVAAFFPHIYNEDWLFLYGAGCAFDSAAGTAGQRRYDPFAPSRAASEEFGDLLAEGILQLTNAGIDYLQSSEHDWRLLLAERKSLIQRIRGQLGAKNAEHMAVKSLLEAEARLGDITPQMCVAYLTAWGHDLDLFRERFASLPYQGTSVAQIIEAAGLKPAQPTRTIEYNLS